VKVQEHDMPEVAIVVPVHNEAGNVRELHARTAAACATLDFALFFVDDGSTDDTAALCRELAESDPRVNLVSLVANVGHQVALHAGLAHARGEYVIMMDGDLQHPPELIPRMIECARRQRADVVHMIKTGSKEGPFKRAFSFLFYRVFNALTGSALVPGASDFRLITRRVHRVLLSLVERRPFYRAMIPALRFPACSLTFEVPPRFAGRSSYTFLKSMRLAVEAFLYHSTMPLHVMMVVGMIVAVSAFLYALISIGVRLAAAERVVPGWADVIVSILILGGLNLTFLGLIGKYIALLIEHEKHRPTYIVDEERSRLHAPQREEIPV